MSFTFPKSKFQPDTRLIKPNGQNDPSKAAVALVTKTDDGSMEAIAGAASEGGFDTVEIEGRTYVLNMIPFGK